MSDKSGEKETLEALSRRPEFSAIDYAKIEQQLDQLLKAARLKIAELEKTQDPTWGNFMQPQEQTENDLDIFWSPISHLNSVLNSDELRRRTTRVCLS